VKYGGQVELTLKERIPLTSNSFLFRFTLPEPDLVMGTNVSNHVRFNCIRPTEEFPDGVLVRRFYTPTSGVTQEGYVDLPIKVYRGDVHPDYMMGGQLTSWLESVNVGDKILVDGPYKRVEYFGNGYFRVKGRIVKKKNVFFVAGGTGITIFYPILKAALESDDPTKFTLIYSNTTEDDIILKHELDYLSKQYPTKFTYVQTITKSKDPENIKAHSGYITIDMLKRYLPLPKDDSLLINMGPKGLNNAFAEIILNHTKFDPNTMVISKAVNRMIQNR